MKNKKIIILVGVCLILLALVLFLIFKDSRQPKISQVQTGQVATVYKADYLSSAEKQKLDIPDNVKVQALKRSTQGEVMVYKIIRAEKDVVNPNDIEPISPRGR